MKWLRDMPIKRKVTLVILCTCTVVLLLACAFLAIYQMVHYRQGVVRNTTVLADVLSKSVQASVTYQDEAVATRILTALEAVPNVAAAWLYDRDGKLFSDFKGPKAPAQIPAKPPEDGFRFENGYLEVVRPVMQDDKRIGSIALLNDLQGLYDRLEVFGIVAALVLIGGCLVALMVASPLQRTISEPIITLTEAVRTVAERRDYTLRLPELGRDETGSLTASVNQLLGSIDKRDKALRTVNESLVRSETQLQTIVENLNEGLVVSDLNGELMHFNRAALALHGFASMDECRRNVSAMTDTFELCGLDGKVWPLEQWPLPRILRGEVVRDLEVKVRRLDSPKTKIFSYGGTLVRDADGKPIMAVVSMNDITERKLAEKKISDQAARVALLNQITRATGERLDIQSVFQVVVRTVEDQLPVDFCCICLYDAVAHELSVASVGVQSGAFALEMAMDGSQRVPVGENGLSRCVTGILVYEPRAENSPHPFPQRLSKAGLRSFVAAPLSVESKVFGVLIAARREVESFSSGECEFLRQLSEHVALSAHQAQLHTALQQAYDDLRLTQQAVMQQERLRALGQMASGIAHDINNAISPVALYTESLLETEPNLSARARDYLETIQHSIEDVAQTVARMREFYRQREIALELLAVQLNPLVQQVINLSRARWSDMPQQKGIHIELATNLGQDLPAVAGVESEIREALLNLVFNAVDAMPDGGKLTVRTKALRPDGASENDPVSSVAIEISDTGMGMSEDTRRRCLEPFFTTKGERGTGLGLAMVYGTTRRHGAEIEIDSELGRGTTMRLVFPVSKLAAESAPGAAAFLPVPTRLRILIIDDDPLLLKSLSHILDTDGHIVTAANGGQAGIDAFYAAQMRGEDFAVVFTDLGMPYVDGRKVAAAIKAASAETPVILLTGWGQRLVAEGDVPPHVDKVLNKPPKLRELREAMAECRQGVKG